VLARLLHGQHHLLLGDLAAAQGEAEAVVAHGPGYRGHDAALVVLAEVALRRGDREAALALARRALAWDPRSVASQLNVASLDPGFQAGENPFLSEEIVWGPAGPSPYAHQVALLSCVAMHRRGA
jgi:hypothetical protein